MKTSAELIARARDGFSLNAAEIGRIVGKSARTVRRRLEAKPRAVHHPARWYVGDWAPEFGILPKPPTPVTEQESTAA